MSLKRLFYFCVGLSLCCASFLMQPVQARADSSTDHQVWHFFSNTGTLIFLAAGVGSPLIEDGKQGGNHALRSADALLTSELLSDGFKSLVKEQRPDSLIHDSFPSGHATDAFAVATIQSDLHPRQAPYWYAGAALIAASRVGLHRHTVGDVLGGAALGYGIGRLELSSRRGLLLAPFIRPEQRVYGFTLSKKF